MAIASRTERTRRKILAGAMLLELMNKEFTLEKQMLGQPHGGACRPGLNELSIDGLAYVRGGEKREWFTIRAAAKCLRRSCDAMSFLGPGWR